MSGFRSALLARLRRILRRHWIVTFEKPVTAKGSIEVVPPPGVTIRLGTMDDAAGLRPLLMSSEPLEARFARKDVVLVAEQDGRLVGCQWIAGGPKRLDNSGSKVIPRRHERYCYGLYVLPEFRRRGISRALHRASLAEGQSTGARMYFCHVLGSDPVSRERHLAVGWTPREECFGVVLLNRFVIALRRGRSRGPSVPPGAPGPSPRASS